MRKKKGKMFLFFESGLDQDVRILRLRIPQVRWESQSLRSSWWRIKMLCGLVDFIYENRSLIVRGR